MYLKSFLSFKIIFSSDGIGIVFASSTKSPKNTFSPEELFTMKWF